MSAYFHEWICEMETGTSQMPHRFYSRTDSTSVRWRRNHLVKEIKWTRRRTNERREAKKIATRKEYRKCISSKIASIASERWYKPFSCIFFAFSRPYFCLCCNLQRITCKSGAPKKMSKKTPAPRIRLVYRSAKRLFMQLNWLKTTITYAKSHTVQSNERRSHTHTHRYFLLLFRSSSWMQYAFSRETQMVKSFVNVTPVSS